MNTQRKRKKTTMAISLALLICFISTGSGIGAALQNPDAPSAPFIIFLPYVFSSAKPPGGGGTSPKPVGDIFGVESSYIDSNLLNKASGVNTYWWRYFAFSWKNIEPNNVAPSQYNWGAVNEHHLRDAAANGHSIVATVKFVPQWAQAIVDPQSIQCSPIKDDADTIAEFKQFLTTLVNRYKEPPYNIKYWQFWNEPDVDPKVLVAEGSLYTSPFGCWGDDTNPYYGGEKYGKFLAIFGQTVKDADPQAKVTNGGMLLDCNPEENPNCLQGKFFEGTIRGLIANNGLPYLDYVSFHVYNKWYGGLAQDEGFPGFKDGGVMLGKAKFLRKVMTDYNINPLKPLIMTEAGLMCVRPDSAPLPSGVKCTDITSPPEYDEHQAQYVVWVYVRAIANDISGVMWYMLNYQSYRHVGLMFSNGNAKPAYFAYQYMVSQLYGSDYVGTLDQYWPDLRAYAFSKDGHPIWVIWAPDLKDHAIALPAGFQSAYDKFGNQIILPPGATTININSPTYLFLN